MTDREQKDLRSYCAFLLKEYGFYIPPNDPVIPALYIIHKEMQLNNQNNKTLASRVKEASSRIHPKEFHFHYPGEALKFQLGVALKWILSGLLVLLSTWIGVWYWSMAKDVNKARTILEASGKANELLKVVQKDKAGYYFIDFKVSKGDSIQFFKEFRKLNANTVRVYLGKE
ncbi:MAG TPA: hypothetical protein PKN99_06015 [Cyclobacteriaceae bacterium]|jgi:hypothetical protein|nr:hypothetical protein [Cyclobacteriaceae bacterium]